MLRVGDIAQDFTLYNAQGVSRNLDELLATGPVVLAFFKVSCPTCQLTVPFLERFHAQRQMVCGISQDDARATGAFAGRYTLTFPMLLDEGKRGFPVSNAFGITNVPTMFQVEQDHRISWASMGFIKAELEALGHLHHVGLFHADDDVPAVKHG